MEDKKKIQINKFLFIHIGSICMGIFAWWMVTDGLGIFRSNALPSPMKVAATFIKKWFEAGWCNAAATSFCQSAGCPRRLSDRSDRWDSSWHIHGMER